MAKQTIEMTEMGFTKAVLEAIKAFRKQTPESVIYEDINNLTDYILEEFKSKEIKAEATEVTKVIIDLLSIGSDLLKLGLNIKLLHLVY